MAGMTRSEVLELMDAATEQGVGVTRTTKGVLFRFPDQQTTMVHWTTSDVRARANAVAAFKRSGISTPFDATTKLPGWSNKKPRKVTLDRTQQVLDAMDNPRRVKLASVIESYSELHECSVNGARQSVPSALFTLGFKPHHKQRGVRVRPRTESEAASELGPVLVTTPPPASPPEPEPTVQVEPTGREFIDTADSWCVELDQLPDSMTVRDMLTMYGAAGLSAEIRVWRA